MVTLLWSLAPSLHTRQWGGDRVVFVSSTGGTHLLEGQLLAAYESLANGSGLQTTSTETDDPALLELADLGIAVAHEQ